MAVSTPTGPARVRPKTILIGLLVLLLGYTALRVAVPDEQYEVKILMTSFSNAYEGAAVTIAGQVVGEISDVEVKDGQAMVTATVDEGHAPLHAGTTARLAWQSLVGRRSLELTPGPATNEVLPSGKVIASASERVELDDVLASLDPATREDVRSLVAELEGTLATNEIPLNRTLETAAPLVDAVSEVVKALGDDGPAIRNLVSDLRRLTARMNAKDDNTERVVSNLHTLVSQAAAQQGQIRAALDRVPGALVAGTRVLGKVPATVDEAQPLLEDLRPATAQLPDVVLELVPVLGQLRPTLRDLRPTLASARDLLGETPDLLGLAMLAVPEAQSALDQLQPAVEFLRPYTPEVGGWLTNWTSLFAPKNSAGHYARALVPASASSFNSNFTGIMPPGIVQWEAPQPGDTADVANSTPFDATGEAIR